jgi:hypothetical protein
MREEDNIARNAGVGAVAVRLPVSAGKPPDALPVVRYLKMPKNNHSQFRLPVGLVNESKEKT